MAEMSTIGTSSNAGLGSQRRPEVVPTRCVGGLLSFVECSWTTWSETEHERRALFKVCHPMRQVTIKYAALRTCLVNLPLSLYGPLFEKGVTPQSLVVELGWSFAGKSHKAVTGWSGLVSRVIPVSGSRQPTDALEIDAQFAREIGLKEGQPTHVSFKLAVSQAKTVNIVPVSADDWEILELHADQVEQDMLGQVRAVCQGQHVCVWAGASKTFIRFNVESTTPDETVRLGPQTEVVIAPKLRPSLVAKAVARQHADVPAFDLRLFRLLPSEMGHLCKLQLDHLDPSSRAAFVSPALYNDLIKEFPSGTCGIALQLFKSHSSTRHPTKNHQPSASENDEPHTKRGKEKTKPKGVSFIEAIDVPDGHLWLNPLARAALGLEEDASPTLGFEMIRFEPLKASVAPAPTPALNGLVPSLPDRATPLSSPAPSMRNELVPPVSLGDRLAGNRSEPPLAGVQDKIEEAARHIRYSLSAWHQGTPSVGLTIKGSLGTGKTSLLNATSKVVSQDANCLAYTRLIDCSKYVDERPTVLKEKFRDWFDEACWRSPAVLFLDNLDRMVPAEVEHIDPFRSTQIANLFASAALQACADRPVVLVIGASTSPGLHSLISSLHLCDETITLRAPTKDSRKEIISSLVQSKISGSLLQQQVDCTAVSAMTDGYLPTDLRDLVDRAIHASLSSKQGQPSILTEEHFRIAQEDFTPISLRNIKLQQSETRWEDIGGLVSTRRVLRETLEWPTKYARIFANCPLRLRSGLLLYGYPGCGKTLLASAAAKECGLNFISVKGPELLNKYIGASEKSVRDLFERAQAARPCVLFFDEFDSIAPRRGHDSTGVTDRVVNQLLTQMDGAEGLEGVYVLAATSRPDLIDPALLRPGRLDKSLICDMPDQSDRESILAACSRKIHFAPDVDFSYYASKTDGYTGADLQALTYNANLEAIHEVMHEQEHAKMATETGTDDADDQIDFITINPTNTSKAISAAENDATKTRLRQVVKQPNQSPNVSNLGPRSAPKKHVIVSEQHMERALQAMRPSMPAPELRRLKAIYNSFVSKRSNGGLPASEASSEIGARSSLM